MVDKMLVARLSAVLPTDPSVALWTWIKSLWANSTGYTVPAVTAVKFDTKFGDILKGYYNFVIVEKFPEIIKPQILGGKRDTITETKRLQILCIGPNAKDTKWKMEKHIDSLVSANKDGLQTTYGIDEVMITQWNEIPVSPDADVTQLKSSKIDQARSSAIVSLRYDQYATAV